MQAEAADAGIAVTDLQPEDAAEMRLNHVEIFSDQADLPHSQHGAPLSDCRPQRTVQLTVL